MTKTYDKVPAKEAACGKRELCTFAKATYKGLLASVFQATQLSTLIKVV